MACSNIMQLMELKSDFVSEAASAEAFTHYAARILKGDANIIVISAAALADEVYFEEIKQVAIENNT